MERSDPLDIENFEQSVPFINRGLELARTRFQRSEFLEILRRLESNLKAENEEPLYLETEEYSEIDSDTHPTLLDRTMTQQLPNQGLPNPPQAQDNIFAQQIHQLRQQTVQSISKTRILTQFLQPPNYPTVSEIRDQLHANMLAGEYQGDMMRMAILLCENIKVEPKSWVLATWDAMELTPAIPADQRNVILTKFVQEEDARLKRLNTRRVTNRQMPATQTSKSRNTTNRSKPKAQTPNYPKNFNTSTRASMDAGNSNF